VIAGSSTTTGGQCMNRTRIVADSIRFDDYNLVSVDGWVWECNFLSSHANHFLSYNFCHHRSIEFEFDDGYNRRRRTDCPE
jgi:hypothetical protein